MSSQPKRVKNKAVKDTGATAKRLSEKDYITLKEMAENIGCSYGIIKRDIDLGRLPAYRIGRKYFIRLSEVGAYAEALREKHSVNGYTIKQLMEILPLSYAFLVDLIKTGKLTAIKVGRQYIIPQDEFERFMQENKLA